MKKLFFIIFLLLPLINFSQGYVRNMLGDSVNKSTKLKSDRFRSMWDGKIKGEKYDSPDFSLGKVNGDELFLRYNLYNDEFELKKTINGSMQFVERTLSKVVVYKMNKHFFLPYYYRGGKNFNVGYLSLLKDLDSIRFYRKDEVKFQPATFSPTTIEIGFPPRFIKRKLFFIQKEEATPIQIGKRKLIKLIESLSLDLQLK
tara:strand:+ start:5076 stop:5678 length:603 start_codon:yes stop_codon:yes gene_type:complete